MKEQLGGRYGKAMRIWGLAAGLAILLGLSLPAFAQAKFPVSGYGSVEYRWSHADDETYGDATDEDLFGYLSLNLGDPLVNPVTGYIFGRLSYDLTNPNPFDEYYPLADVNDTYDSRFLGNLYLAYAQFNKAPYMESITIGRQMLLDTPVWLYLDGAEAVTAEAPKTWLNAQLGIYGGVPVHLYEADQKDNALYGAFAQVRPWPGNRLRFDWTHAEGEYLFGNELNDYYSVEMWQTLAQYLQLEGRYSMLEDDSHDAEGRMTFYQPDWDVLVQGSYYELLTREQDLALEFDPFFAALHTFYPYWQVGALVSKGLGKYVSVDAGWDMRRLRHNDQENDFNHEFSKYYAALNLSSLFDRLDFSVSYDLWQTEHADHMIQSYGADAAYHVTKDLELSAGTYFDLYKYDYYFEQERDRVQTYFGRVGYLPAKGPGLDVTYEYDDSDLGDYQVLRAEAKYSF